MFLYTLRHLAVEALGFILLVAGVLMLVLPGPGIAFIILSITILATEFVWAKRLLRRLKMERKKYTNLFLVYFKF